MFKTFHLKHISIASLAIILTGISPLLSAGHVFEIETASDSPQKVIFETLAQPGALTLQIEEPTPSQAVIVQPPRGFLRQYLLFGWLYDWAFPPKAKQIDPTHSHQTTIQNSVNIHLTFNLGNNPTLYGPLMGLVRTMSVTQRFQADFTQFFLTRLLQPQGTNPISLVSSPLPLEPLAIEQWDDVELERIQQQISRVKEQRGAKRTAQLQKNEQDVSLAPTASPHTPIRKHSSAEEAPRSPLKVFSPADAAKQRSQYEQFLYDEGYPATERFWEHVAQEEWLAQKVYEALREGQYRNASEFDIVPTKFNNTYKLVITSGVEKETKLIKK